MYHAEYDMLFDVDDLSITPSERMVYLLLRRWMDNNTCITGIKRGVNYRYLIEHTEYKPKVGSKNPPVRLSVGQIKRIIKSLVDRGWILPLHDTSNIKSQMIFKMVVAELEKNRIREERHNSDTRASTLENTPTHTENTSVNIIATAQQRHESSDTPLTNLNNYSLYSADEIFLNQELINISKSVGYESNADLLATELVIFQNHSNNRNKSQTLNDWKADWTRWCAQGKKFKRGSTNATNQQSDEREKISRQLSDPEYAMQNF